MQSIPTKGVAAISLAMADAASPEGATSSRRGALLSAVGVTRSSVWLPHPLSATTRAAPAARAIRRLFTAEA
jgi:hypothetical protein